MSYLKNSDEDTLEILSEKLLKIIINFLNQIKNLVFLNIIKI